jgi:predicted nucleotidyltransferase
MTQAELFTLLKTSGYPVAYRSFKVDNNNPPPASPYIVYLRMTDENISSDTKVHGKFKNYQIELYTDKKDLVAEQKLEKILNRQIDLIEDRAIKNSFFRNEINQSKVLIYG